MTHPKKRAGVAVLLLGTFLTSPAAVEAKYSVIDMTNVKENVAQAKTAVNQLTELTQMRNLMQEQLSTLGEFGALGDLFSGSSASGIGSESDFYENMKKFAFDPCTVNLCQGGDNPVGTTDIEEAKTWAEENFFASTVLDFETERDLREIRRRGRISSAVKGVALSTIVSNDLAGAGEGATALEEIVEASDTLRGDVRANSAIALAAYELEIQQLAVLSSMLQIASMDSIDAASIYHEAGGTSFADAFVEGDLSAQDSNARTKITPPEKGSAGGSGFGGGLISAISGSDVSGLFAGGLDSNNALSSIFKGGGLTDLVGKIGNGSLPGIDPDTLGLGSVVADAGTLASSALSGLQGDGIASMSAGLSQMVSGISKDSPLGNASALMGISQTLSEARGNPILGGALNTAGLALQSGDPGKSIDFARGVLRDVAKNGVVGSTADYLENKISDVANGLSDPQTLVLDASAILASRGRNADQDVARMLSVDTSQVGPDYLQSSLADTLKAIADATGNEEFETVSRSLANTSENDLQAVRDALSQKRAEMRQRRGTQDGAQSNARSNSTGVFD